MNMARKTLVIVLLATAACLVQGKGEFDLSINSTTNVTDGKGAPLAMANLAIAVSEYNRTRDSDSLNAFVQSQIMKLQKNPELFAENDKFDRTPPAPPGPGPLAWSYSVTIRANWTTGSNHASNGNFNMTLDLYTRKKRGHEAPLFALRAPTF